MLVIQLSVSILLLCLMMCISLQPECTNVCFWYIPPSMRGQKEDEAWWKKVNEVHNVYVLCEYTA